MKQNDLIFAFVVLLIFAPFFISKDLYNFYNTFNQEHGMIMSFVKFAVLATLGEVIGLRIRKGVYNELNFGILPRAIVWGFLGLAIKGAFIVFATGSPQFLEYLGVKNAVASMAGGFTYTKLLSAFGISVFMNIVFSPVMMTFHKITDIHIVQQGGMVLGLFRPIPMEKILGEINWNVQWNFVFKKTIPFFWVPAHTITFLLPADLQVLYAAFLGIVLGLIMAIASLKEK